jgi:threonine aldolase
VVGIVFNYEIEGANMDDLKKVYPECKQFINGNGPRNISVLTEAFEKVDINTASDMYGQGVWIDEFQEELAREAGKEAGVFFPSGTMAQQIALRIACDQKNIYSIAYHPLAHLEIHEQDGLKKLHQIKTILLGDQKRLLTLQDFMSIEQPISCLLIELPQREMGGYLPDYADLVEISKYCQEKGIHLHLDGARLFEVLPYYKKTLQEICVLFDSVYLSFYKGIGAVAGAVLLGDHNFCKEAKVWKRRYGGDLISLYPYIIPAKYYMDRRRPLMETYYEKAKDLAALLNKIQGVATYPQIPVSNMFHVSIEGSREKLTEALVKLYHSTGIGLTNNIKEKVKGQCFFEVSIGDALLKLEDHEIDDYFKEFDELLKNNK